jgi:hypothetical protein
MFEGTSRSPAMGQLADGARVAQGVFADATAIPRTSRCADDLIGVCRRAPVVKVPGNCRPMVWVAPLA